MRSLMKRWIRLQKNLREKIRMMIVNLLYSISTKYHSGFTKNPKILMISKELKGFVFQIAVEERMKKLDSLLFLELRVEVNCILLL
jgi:hypothetical protein